MLWSVSLSANEALLLIGHGSLRYPDAGGVMLQHAEALRKTNSLAQVEVALLNRAPSVPNALARIQTATIRVVPFFMEDGYFNQVAVPWALGIGQQADAGGAPAALPGARTPSQTDSVSGAHPVKAQQRILVCPRSASTTAWPG